IAGVKEVMEISSNTYRITSTEEKDLRPEIFRFAADRNLSMVGLKQEKNSLESIFQELTK
ncbi:gliding motility-associated ABC transporter ATP-binding subunit GldA, partial [Fulvivirgaceae bacterium PWU20]|nr:gliding motility-associated ABC transporter ATP-binding subunit GldA [Chryseosolibacter indicus]